MYPRIIKLTDKNLLKLEQEKGQIIEEGRVITQKIESLEVEMGKIDVRLQKEEAKVDIKDLKEQGNKISKEMDVSVKYYTDEIKKIQQAIFDRMSEKTDSELRKQHEELKKQKEILETERNKKALKAQKFKDRIIPLARKLLKPHLENEYEDFYDIKLENGEIVGSIFSHLDEFEKNYQKRKKQQYLTK